jgi:preprotein translocase subunit SecD
MGSGQISGGKNGFTQDQIDYLVNVLNAGTMPAQVTIVSQKMIDKNNDSKN